LETLCTLIDYLKDATTTLGTCSVENHSEGDTGNVQRRKKRTDF
jgi:hypothetical protein